MCGICGILDFSGKAISEELLKRMTDSFSYRGPDDEGFFLSPPIGLGHRRLSIIDLSQAGRQPMCNEEGSLWLVFNGEIYDFNAHREYLLSKGHIFKSHTDSETIIHLYEEEGIDFLNRLNGMFALALWDVKKQTLLLARDRLGIKPLCYCLCGKRFIFGSEIKAILCDDNIPREIDREALDLYMTLNHIPQPYTIFKDIRKLAPGHYLIAGKEGISVKPYWDIAGRQTPSGDKKDDNETAEYKDRLFHLLESSVKRMLIADVPLGAFLSGGIDSSIIVALMARNSSRPVKTFSIGYHDIPSFDETGYAREVARLNNTEHSEFKLGYKDILETFPRVLEILDEPFADSSVIPTFIVSRNTRDHVTVALSGDGGDELFAGYRMYQAEKYARLYNLIPGFLRDKAISPFINSLPDARDKPWLEKARRIKKLIRGMNGPFAERFYNMREVFPFSLRQEILKEPADRNIYLDYCRETVEKERDRFNGDDINLMLYMDVKGLLNGDMLTKVDRMSMANSLEVRVPFLDHTVVEYIFGLRGDLKLKGRTGKRILLDTFKDLLPPSLLSRPKYGFEMPIGVWLRKDLRFLIDEYLGKGRIEKQGIFNYPVIERIIQTHMTFRRDTSWQLWNLIVFQHWHGRYM